MSTRLKASAACFVLSQGHSRLLERSGVLPGGTEVEAGESRTMLFGGNREIVVVECRGEYGEIYLPAEALLP